MEDTRRYLDALFGDAPSAERQIAIWDMPSKQASFHADPTSAIVRVRSSNDAKADVYCGVGLYRPGIVRGRGKAADVVAVTSLWADIDFGDGHKKPNIPPTQADARKIIDAATLAPTMVVNSGHGYHCYWGLVEPIDNGEAATLAKRWGAWIAKCADGLGYVVDSVFDLSRVLRVPGTVNHKGGGSAPVEVAELSDRRYQPDDFEIYLPPGGVADLTVGASAPVGDFAILPTAYPDARMLDAALANDPRFKRTWEKRREFVDQSASSYDMSLAVWAAQQDLTDQQTADLIIGFRVKHGLDLRKVTERKDYLARTIARGRDSRYLATPERAVIGDHQTSEAFHQAGEDPGGILRAVRAQLEIPISGFIQRGKSDSRYAITLDGGDEIAIGTAKDLLSPVAFRHAVYDQTKQVVRRISGAAWDIIIRQLTKIVQEVEMPEGDNVVESWLGDYLISRPPVPEESWPSALAIRMPFERDGCLYIHLPDFRAWVHVAMNERESAQSLRASMHKLGFVGKSVVAKIKGKQICRWYWKRLIIRE